MQILRDPVRHFSVHYDRVPLKSPIDQGGVPKFVVDVRWRPDPNKKSELYSWVVLPGQEVLPHSLALPADVAAWVQEHEPELLKAIEALES